MTERPSFTNENIFPTQGGYKVVERKARQEPPLDIETVSSKGRLHSRIGKREGPTEAVATPVPRPKSATGVEQPYHAETGQRKKWG